MNIAIIGCGQLARMMAQAAHPLGIKTSFLAENGESSGCVMGLGPVVMADDAVSTHACYQQLGCPEVITVEREHVDISRLRQLATQCSVFPAPETVEITGHRGLEKTALQQLNIPVAPFKTLAPGDALAPIIAELGLPVFVKSVAQGYDGKNQWHLTSEAEVEQAWSEISEHHCVVEANVNYLAEVSLVGARDRQGNLVFYPLAENRHQRGILLSSVVPAAKSLQQFTSQAQTIFQTIVDAWQYVGVLAVEFFVTAEGLIVNELAPRVHNSGHWSLDGAVHSQFENHIRAITGRPLGATDLIMPTAMVNLLGTDVLPKRLDADCLTVYRYQKSPRLRRKVGHINLMDSEVERLNQRLMLLIEQIYPDFEQAGLA